MEIKKSPKADLESKKSTFILIGLVVSLFVIWRVFEYKSYDKQSLDEFQRSVEVIEEEMVEITKQEQPKPQPPAPKPQVTQIEIVEAEIFKVVEVMPEFPGGAAKMMEYIQKNMKYPMMARESDIQGRVFVNFVVEPDGSISNVAVLRGIGGGCDEEAVRVVQSMPKWNPGKQRGTAVRCAFTVPIIFKLQ